MVQADQPAFEIDEFNIHSQTPQVRARYISGVCHIIRYPTPSKQTPCAALDQQFNIFPLTQSTQPLRTTVSKRTAKMRYLALPFIAAMLTSPIAAFDICRALHCYEDSEAPAVWVTLKAVDLKDRNYQPRIRVDLTESDQVCDPSKVEIFMQPLAIDKDGRGEGSIMLDPETWAKSSWEFSCSTPKDSSKEHKLSFTIHAINGEEIEKMTLVTRFRQMWPIVFTSVESDSMAERPEFSRGTLHYVPEGGYRYEDYEEL